MVITFSLHAHGETLDIAAVLAAVALAFVNQTVAVVSAGVGQLLPHRALEEAFTAFTAGAERVQLTTLCEAQS